MQTDNKPKLTIKKGDAIQDTRISVCTDCGWGIFPRHMYKWSNRGLIHVDCTQRITK